MSFKDHPIEDCVKQASRMIDQGHQVYQKFTCDKCGSRQTMEEPDKFFTEGICEECGYITDLKFKGCNYLVHMRFRK